MPSFRPPQDYVFFADEAGISNDRFTVVGGISIHRNNIDEVHAAIADYRQNANMKAELKWSKISNQKLSEYQELVDYFFALNSTDAVHFNAIIFDSHQWNHNVYNGGDSDVGLSKLYYQLALHKFIKLCGQDCEKSLAICVDKRNSSTSLIELKNMLNAAAARDFGYKHQPLKQLVPWDSKLDDILQMNDVILGAVCAARNGKHKLPKTRAAKREIAKTVLEKSGLNTFDLDSPRNIHRFGIWNMRPRPRG
ncbi:MAG: DUF3800 domain-containing protein [Pseudomonadota bacterium]